MSPKAGGGVRGARAVRYYAGEYPGHEHDYAQDLGTPAEFLPAFARRMIDEGASLVAGHGPHLLRGMEIYKGCPFFYSLGNFLDQNELLQRLPSDSYERFRAEPLMTPGLVVKQRKEDDRKGFPAKRHFWETVLPICSFVDGKLSGLEIYPVTLGLGEARHLRGRPRLAAGQEAARILDRFARQSKLFGTHFVSRGTIATIDACELPPQTIPRRNVYLGRFSTQQEFLICAESAGSQLFPFWLSLSVRFSSIG
jgi:hypothetical protein